MYKGTVLLTSLSVSFGEKNATISYSSRCFNGFETLPTGGAAAVNCGGLTDRQNAQPPSALYPCQLRHATAL